jgi:K+-transporting ATPase ATPase C chain
MKTVFSELRGALVSTAVLAVACCGVYPLVVTGVAQALFADKANGSLIKDNDGTIRGSALLAQGFTGEPYFHPRPSAAGANGYDAASSSGSNLGPTSQKLHDAIKDRIAAYRVTNGLTADLPVPADAVTASGSGLDPHISMANADLQAPRVARARQMDVESLRALIRQSTTSPDLGILGEAGVNVLQLNLALDTLPPTSPPSP